MTTTSKIALSALAAGILAVSQAQAGLINGSVSFVGGVTAYVNTLGTGTVASDYTTAHSLSFSGDSVDPNTAHDNGTFTGLANSPVTFYNPLVINPVTSPTTGQVLWTITAGSHVYFFTLNAPMTETLSSGALMVLSGTGVISDNIAGDVANTGSWFATFTTGSNSNGVTFAFNSSSAANPAVPEAGTSVLLLALGLAAIGTYAQFRKQVA